MSDSFDEVDALWNREIERRAEAFDRGEAKVIPAADVFEESRRIVQ